MKIKQIQKTAQDFGGFDPSSVPPEASSMIGSSGSVDASRLKGYFNKVDDAISLVNGYDSSLLKDIVYIFDFSDSGAYGVYVDKLSETLKLNKQKLDLENMGYQVEIDNNLGITATDPTGEKSSEEIQRDMDSTSQQLDQIGGVTIGLNMAKIQSSVEEDVAQNTRMAEQNGTVFDEDKKEWLVLVNVASTIVHEATHALGHHDEATPEGAEDSFLDAKMDEINSRYQASYSGDEESFVPLEVSRKTRMASSSGNWYKEAQSYTPKSFYSIPRGSDLSGRFPASELDPAAGGRAPWGLQQQQGANVSLEERLGRQFMSRLPPDVIQEKQTINEQLQKMNQYLPHFDTKDGIEQRLMVDHVADLGYVSLEGLLDERRPRPLMLTIDKETKEEGVKVASETKKTASTSSSEHLFGKELDELTISKLRELASTDMPEGKYRVFWSGKSFIQEDIERFLWYWDNKIDSRDQMALEFISMPHAGDNAITVASKLQKEATLFGWHNNLDISDGSTVPGLGDRVMEWEDEEESFGAYESWIKGQSRYNPEYNADGTYYVLDNIRGWPYPAKQINESPNYQFPRAASANVNDMDVDNDGDVDKNDIYMIIKVLNKAKRKIAKGDIASTRFIVSEDMLPIFNHMFKNDDLNVYVFEDNHTFLGTPSETESIFCVWVTSPDVKESDVREVENFLGTKEISSEKPNNLIEKLLSLNSSKENIINEVIKAAKDICKEYGVVDLYLVGGYPRDIQMGNPVASVKDLDFSAAWPNQSIKVGGLLAERLGVQDAKIYKRTMTLSFTYKGLKIDFKGNFSPVEIRSKMREHGIPTTPLNNDIYNRDFVMNMMIYDVAKGKIHDITKEAEKDIKDKVIRTYFDPDGIVKMNPLIMTRALKFKLRYGFDITPELKAAIINNVDLMFDGRYSDERLKVAKQEVEKENCQEAQRLFDIYGLNRLKDY